MDNMNIVYVILSILVLVEGMLFFAIASLYRKVECLMANQAELNNALDVTKSDLDAIKAVVDKMVAGGGGQNVVNQAEFDAFVAKAQAVRAQADALAESIKPLDSGLPVEGSSATSGGTAAPFDGTDRGPNVTQPSGSTGNQRDSSYRSHR